MTQVKGHFNDEEVLKAFVDNELDAMFMIHWSPEYIVNSSYVYFGYAILNQDMRSHGPREDNPKNADILDVFKKVSAAAFQQFIIVLLVVIITLHFLLRLRKLNKHTSKAIWNLFGELIRNSCADYSKCQPARMLWAFFSFAISMLIGNYLCNSVCTDRKVGSPQPLVSTLQDALDPQWTHVVFKNFLTHSMLTQSAHGSDLHKLYRKILSDQKALQKHLIIDGDEMEQVFGTFQSIKDYKAKLRLILPNTVFDLGFRAPLCVVSTDFIESLHESEAFANTLSMAVYNSRNAKALQKYLDYRMAVMCENGIAFEFSKRYIVNVFFKSFHKRESELDLQQRKCLLKIQDKPAIAMPESLDIAQLVKTMKLSLTVLAVAVIVACTELVLFRATCPLLMRLVVDNRKKLKRKLKKANRNRLIVQRQILEVKLPAALRSK